MPDAGVSPGVVISIRGASDEEAAQQISSEDGHFAVRDLPPARYRVRASLDGFEPAEKDALPSRPRAVSH